MYVSMKYLILYIGAGVATGWLTKGERTASLVGIGVAALIGASFDMSYAVLSAIEFAVGLSVAKLMRNRRP